MNKSRRRAPLSPADAMDRAFAAYKADPSCLHWRELEHAMYAFQRATMAAREAVGS